MYFKGRQQVLNGAQNLKNVLISEKKYQLIARFCLGRL